MYYEGFFSPGVAVKERGQVFHKDVLTNTLEVLW